MAQGPETRVPLIEAKGDELRALLAPVTPEEFVHDYFGKKPLFVKGFAGKYRGLFDGQGFQQALTAPGPLPDDFLRASFDRKTTEGTSAKPTSSDGGDWVSKPFRASVEQAVPLFKAGATLCLTQVETRVPSLDPFVAAVKRQLGYPGKVTFNAYLSPPRTGFNWHFDSRIASTLQIEGSKTWRYSNRTSIEWPRANGALRSDGVGVYTDPKIGIEPWEQLAPFDEKDITEVLLEPGDLLILPAGVWHDACGGAGGSLALNLSFTPISYTLLVRQLLEQMLTPDSGWRGPAPALPKLGGEPGEIDPAGLAAIATQLASAGKALQSLSADSAAVMKLWSSYVQSPNPGNPAPPAPLARPVAIERGQRFRIRADGDVHAMLADGGSRLCVSVGTTRGLDLSGDAARFVQRALRAGSFVTDECLAWSDDGQGFAWDDVQEMLARLQSEGLIEHAP